jgi:hypothetical protein
MSDAHDDITIRLRAYANDADECRTSTLAH